MGMSDKLDRASIVEKKFPRVFIDDKVIDFSQKQIFFNLSVADKLEVFLQQHK